MSNKKCKHCNEIIYSRYHTCSSTGKSYDSERDAGDFITSFVLGAATDSALLGGLLGGSMAGGLLGDLLDGDLFD